MIRTDGDWLRALAAMVDAGEVEVGRVEPKNSGVLLGTFQPGTFAKAELVSDVLAVSLSRRPRIR